MRGFGTAYNGKYTIRAHRASRKPRSVPPLSARKISDILGRKGVRYPDWSNKHSIWKFCTTGVRLRLRFCRLALVHLAPPTLILRAQLALDWATLSFVLTTSIRLHRLFQFSGFRLAVEHLASSTFGILGACSSLLRLRFHPTL